MDRWKTFLRNHYWTSPFVLVPSLLIFFLLICLLLAKLASLGAAWIFNYEVSRQDMFRGAIEVESLAANIHGGVTFENLSWDSPEGDPIVRIPKGTLKVNPWDVITGQMKSTTLKEVTLERPAFAVRFDSKMKMDFLALEEDKAEKEDKEESVEERVRNFNRRGRPIQLKIHIIDGHVETFYENRHYIFNHLSLDGNINTKGMTDLHLTTGHFGGMAEGEGVDLDLSVNFKEKGLPSTMKLTARDIDPASLGFGDLHDPMTLTASGQGPIAHPAADGVITAPALHIPALTFQDVEGKVHYEGGLFTFTDVHTRVYGGTASAHGDYHLDSRAFNIYLHGEDLDSRIPTNEPHFYCLVTLDGEIHSDGSPKGITAFGTFHSGKGTYMLIPFKEIKGTFNNRYKAVDFYDVSIDTAFGLIHTDAFHIIDGKLHLGPIEITDEETGETMLLTDAPYRSGSMKTIRHIGENIKDIRRQVEEIKEGL